ncbi:MAG: thioredoxin domain-containing protein [Candidatus Tyrphobacter sp.]
MNAFRFSPRPNRAAEIGWLPWGSAAFERAQRERKPILLSISAVWCHWCHVMDETSYSDPAVIEAIAARFVPIRVDNDERPDVNARYNMGGWPTTAFLAGDGTLLTGATYLPPPQMARVLREVADWYDTHRDEISSHMQASTPQFAREEPRDDLQSAQRIVAAIASTYDEEFGGFGDAPKFPQPELLETLLLESEATGDERLRSMVVRTLLGMSQGGMYDHVEGGFFRYSTTRDWSIPHFEKMAEEHAGLIRTLSLLLVRISHEQLAATLRSCTEYVMRVLRDPVSGFFAGSQDADEEYYAHPMEERRAMQPPFVDRTLYADRNAALAGALVLASATLEDERLATAGTHVLDALWEMRDAGGLLYHLRRRGEAPTIRGLLGDQAAYLRALVEAHEVTGEERFLERACAIADAATDAFSAEDGGFYDHAGIESTLGRLTLRDRPIAENAVAAETLLRLEALSGRARYRTIAERALRACSPAAAGAGAFAAPYVRAVRRLAAPAWALRIVATIADGASFREAARRLPSPFVNVRSVAPARASDMDLPASPHPAAYLCKDGVCGAPARSAADLRAAYDAVLA